MTLAPFLNPEKPQVSPCHAARFISYDPDLNMSGTEAVNLFASRKGKGGRSSRGYACKNDISLLSSRDGIVPEPVTNAHPRWSNSAAHVRGRPQSRVPNWLEPVTNMQQRFHRLGEQGM